MSLSTQERINLWLNDTFDNETKQNIADLQKNNPKELEDAFYRSLEFGTSGLRGIMGVGTNRMNKYVVGFTTQGFANYLNEFFKGQEIKVVIGHDSRNNSRYFSLITAQVFAANGIKVFMYDALRPTPEISYTIIKLQCQAGVIITASHNPKEYNGYKVYFDNGGSIVPPHDKNILNEIDLINSPKQVKWGQENNPLIVTLGQEIDDSFINMSLNQLVYPEIINQQADLKIVYTPIHGSGITLIPTVLDKMGFKNVHIVQEQAQPDGNFPTVVYPNPEEKETMSLGLNKARELDADILLGTDPDADRVGVGIKNHHNEWVLMNGNQTAVLVFSYLIEARKSKGLAQSKDFVVKTIVTTQMLNEIARQNNLHCYDVLTGFKWIADKISELNGKQQYIVGGEESFGLMIGDQLRDKDAVTSVAVLCEMAAFYKNQGKSVYDKLIELYQQYGLYLEDLISITKKGQDGIKQIDNIMEEFRKNPPTLLADEKVIEFLDYKHQTRKNLTTNSVSTLDLPKSNVLQFITEAGTIVSARPSGTEPKIKFYFSVKTQLNNKEEFDDKMNILKQKILIISKNLQLS